MPLSSGKKIKIEINTVPHRCLALGVSGGSRSFGIYQYFKLPENNSGSKLNKLIEKGVKPEEIAYIHDAKTE